jgi:curved DNA-binding protein
LSDPNKRSQYDNPQSFRGFNPNMHDFGFNTNGVNININDIFSQIFGQQPNHPFGHQPKQVFRTKINVSLSEAYTGIEKTLQIGTPAGTKVITVKVPKGIASGGQLRYDNLIENGMLIIEFEVLPDLRFDRKNNDLYANLSVSVLDLITGTKIDFTTLSGEILQININPMTQPFMQLRLPNKGMPVMNSTQFGDQILVIKPVIPANIHPDIINAINHHKDN